MRPNLRRVVFLVFFCSMVLVCETDNALAQHAGFGVRAGASVDPNQFIFGGHIQSGQLIPRLVFRPNLEVGVGSNVTTVAANLELAFFIPIPRQPFDVYAGLGPALLIYSRDNARGFGDSTSAEGGFNFLVGIQHEEGLFGEVKFGAVDSPDFKVTIGYSFR